MKDRSQWARHAVEILVIVLSVLSAFTLDSWWNDRAETRALELELRSVQQEMARNREHLATWLTVHQRIVLGVNTLLAASSGGAEGATISVPDTLVMGVRLVPTIDPSAGALRTIVSSGRLAMVESIELRLALASWQDEVANVTEDEDGGRAFVWESLNPWFRAWFSPADLGRLVGLNSLFWQDPGRVSALPTEQIGIPIDTELQNLLLDRRSYSDVTVTELAKLIGVVDDILDQLSAELD